MSVFITSLNSGSNGNCYYIGTSQEAVLIDVGISCRETERRMQILGLSMQTVKAIFISHEHSDHIKGLPVLSKKYDLPVYITQNTLLRSGLRLTGNRVEELAPYTPIVIGGISVLAFPKYHDAVDPHSFLIRCNTINIGVFTDIGMNCEHVAKHFEQCDAAFLEANYDSKMLEGGHYPQYLKNRIRGGKGHLSNDQALEIFLSHRPPFMTHLLLSHLSKENNNPEHVQQLFNKHAAGVKIHIASRDRQSPVFAIGKHPKSPERKSHRETGILTQMKLF